MSMTQPDERYRAYSEAIQRRVCRTCLDQADDGTCGLTRRVCALERHLPEIVGALVAVHSDRMDDYVAAVEARVCSRCSEQASGECRLRNRAECALYSLLPLVVEAVEEVHGSLSASAPAAAAGTGLGA
jgi:hypothetical protein